MKRVLLLTLVTTLATAQPAPPAIPLNPVASSAIRAVGYDAPTQRLRIAFTSPKPTVYDFCAVPEALFIALLNAPSKGTFYHQAIRDKYPCEDLKK